MKRFSKIVSVIIEAPSATHISAMNCACMSVAKPGRARSSRRCRASRRWRRPAAPCRLPRHFDAGIAQDARHGADHPAARPSSSTSPPVIAAAQA
jgi:hypothetical protein